MSFPSSNTAIFSVNDVDEDYGTDDPLLDYCEDYAWDPSDWELETQDYNGNWEFSENDEVMPISSPQVPPQACTSTTTFVRDNTSHGCFGTRICTMLLQYYIVIKKALRLKIIKRRWVIFKWLFVVLNVMIEVCQAMFSQENAQGKLSTRAYLKSSIITSAFCLMISLVETIHEGKKSKVVWHKRGCFGWFYYPGRQRRLFGRFSLIMGVVSSMVQLCINLVALVISKNFLKFDILPLLLSSGYLVAALIDCRGNKSTSRAHGRRSKGCSRKVKMVDRSFGSNVIGTNFEDESYGLISDEFTSIRVNSYSNMLSINFWFH